MKLSKSTLLAMLLIPVIGMLSACGGGGEPAKEAPAATEQEASNDEAAEEATEAPAATSSVSVSDRGATLYSNATVAFMGVIVVGMSDAFGGMAEGIADAFANSEDAAEIDAKLESVQGEAIDKVLEMQGAINDALASINEEDATTYDKMFSGPTMHKGFDMVDNASIGAGFARFDEPMSPAEMKRWVIFLAQKDADETNPAYTHFQELMQWYSELNNEYQNDPDITTVTDRLREKMN